MYVCMYDKICICLCVCCDNLICSINTWTQYNFKTKEKGYYLVFIELRMWINN